MHCCAQPALMVSFVSAAADANILINSCRLAAQQYLFAYQEPIPVDQLVRTLCDQKQVRCDRLRSGCSRHMQALVPRRCCLIISNWARQRRQFDGHYDACAVDTCNILLAMIAQLHATWTVQGYTQYGGLRPFGVSLLYAGWDGQNKYAAALLIMVWTPLLQLTLVPIRLCEFASDQHWLHDAPLDNHARTHLGPLTSLIPISRAGTSCIRATPAATTAVGRRPPSAPTSRPRRTF